jgi:hypothetical protein
VGAGRWAYEWLFSAANPNRLPFSYRTGHRIKVTAEWALSRDLPAKLTHGSVLPASWRTLYELSRVPDDVFERAIGGVGALSVKSLACQTFAGLMADAIGTTWHRRVLGRSRSANWRICAHTFRHRRELHRAAGAVIRDAEFG